MRDPVTVVACGSRTVRGAGGMGAVFAALERFEYVSGFRIAALIEGGHRSSDGGVTDGGADWWARVWGIAQRVPVVTVPAEWGKWGRRAGPKRNEEMVRRSDVLAVVAVWDGRSSGTLDCVKRAVAMGLWVYVSYTDGRDPYYLPRFGPPPVGQGG